MQLSDINFSFDEITDADDVEEEPRIEKLNQEEPSEVDLGGVLVSNMDHDDKMQVTDETEGGNKAENEELVQEKPSESSSVEVSDSEMNQDEEAKVDDNDVSPSNDIVLEESSTYENDDLKSILDRHVVVDLPIPEGIIPMGKSELSTILEESAALGESKEYARIQEEGGEEEGEEEEEQEMEMEEKLEEEQEMEMEDKLEEEQEIEMEEKLEVEAEEEPEIEAEEEQEVEAEEEPATESEEELAIETEEESEELALETEEHSDAETQPLQEKVEPVPENLASEGYYLPLD